MATRAPIILLVAVVLLTPAVSRADSSSESAREAARTGMLARTSLWRQRLQERLQALWNRKPAVPMAAANLNKKVANNAANMGRSYADKVPAPYRTRGGSLNSEIAPAAVQPVGRQNTAHGLTPVTGGFGTFIRRSIQEVGRMFVKAPQSSKPGLLARIKTRVLGEKVPAKVTELRKQAEVMRIKAGEAQAAGNLDMAAKYARKADKLDWGAKQVAEALHRTVSNVSNGVAFVDAGKKSAEARRKQLIKDARRLRMIGTPDALAQAQLCEQVAVLSNDSYHEWMHKYLWQRNQDDFKKFSTKVRDAAHRAIVRLDPKSRNVSREEQVRLAQENDQATDEGKRGAREQNTTTNVRKRMARFNHRFAKASAQK